MNKDIVYVNNRLLGYFESDVYKNYSTEEKNNLFLSLKNEIIKKDHNRKMFSLVIGLILLIVAVTLSALMLFNVVSLGSWQWFNYIFIIAIFVFLWILFYYLFGFIFYKKILLNIHFKSSKSKNPNSCVAYASSNYFKWVNSYMDCLQTQSFSITDSKKKTYNVALALKMPSWKQRLIFNGHIVSNIPYYYLIIKNKRIIFLPGIVIIVDGKNSDVFSNSELKCEKENKTYHLFKNDKPIVSFDVKSEFNINFFYFNYEQQ